MAEYKLTGEQWCFLDLLMRAKERGVDRLNRMEILHSKTLPQAAAMKLTWAALTMPGDLVTMIGQHDFQITDAGVSLYRLRRNAATSVAHMRATTALPVHTAMSRVSPAASISEGEWSPSRLRALPAVRHHDLKADFEIPRFGRAFGAGQDQQSDMMPRPAGPVREFQKDELSDIRQPAEAADRPGQGTRPRHTVGYRHPPPRG